MTNDREPKVLTSQEVADLMGWSLEYVRKGMARYGIELVHGWPEGQVRALLASQQVEDPGRGTRPWSLVDSAGKAARAREGKP